MSGRRLPSGFVPSLASALLLCGLGVAAEPAGEYSVKAAFLLNFCRFTTWPEDAFAGHPERHLLCIFGSDPFGPNLDRLVADRQVGGREVQVRRVTFPGDLSGCQLVYVAASELDRLDEIRLAVGHRPALLVGEGERSLALGGMVAFFLRADRVRFRINLDAATEAGLHLDAHMLELAEAVQQAGKP